MSMLNNIKSTEHIENASEVKNLKNFVPKLS